MKKKKNENCLHLGSGPTYSDSPSDNADSSITSSPTDTLRTSKNPSAKVLKKPTLIKIKIEKFKNGDFFIDYSTGWNGVLKGLRKLLELQYRGNSNYANYETPRGVLSLRLSGHNANGNNFSPAHINVSVFVALFEYEHIQTTVKYIEYKIPEETFKNHMQEVVNEIVLATERALNGEEFVMNEKIAEKHSYN